MVSELHHLACLAVISIRHKNILHFLALFFYSHSKSENCYAKCDFNKNIRENATDIKQCSHEIDSHCNFIAAPCVLSAQQQKEREPYRNKAEEEGVNWTPGIKLKHSNDFSLVDAAEKGNLAKVKEQIKSGSSPDSCLVSAHGGETALIAAAQKKAI